MTDIVRHKEMDDIRANILCIHVYAIYARMKNSFGRIEIVMHGHL